MQTAKTKSEGLQKEIGEEHELFHLYKRLIDIVESSKENGERISDYLKKSLEAFEKEEGTKYQKELKNSISRFGEKNTDGIVVSNPKVIKTKGSGKGEEETRLT